ncbi:MAG: 6-pyruvoyl trahydropterin synthase family protein [Bacteroidota bacterium]
MKIVRRATFNAAHRLYRKDWSNEKNDAVFGLCNNVNFHGHNYVLEVGIEGKIDPETGYVIDVKILKDIISSQVTDRYDHKNLNMDCPEFFDLNPTVENIAMVCYNNLLPHLVAYGKLSIKLYETEKNWVEYAGE